MPFWNSNISKNRTFADLSLNMKDGKIEIVHYKHCKSLCALKAALMVNGMSISISTLSQMRVEDNEFSKNQQD